MFAWFWRAFYRRGNAALAREITSCFDGVKWERQAFNCSGVECRDMSGERFFYRAGEIDAAIERLNAVLQRIS
jgi:hypothetical protein